MTAPACPPRMNTLKIKFWKCHNRYKLTPPNLVRRYIVSQCHELWIVCKELVAVVAVIFIFRCPEYLNSKHLQGMYGLTVLESNS